MEEKLKNTSLVAAYASESATLANEQEASMDQDNDQIGDDDGSLFGDGDIDSGDLLDAVQDQISFAGPSMLPFAPSSTPTTRPQTAAISGLSFPKLSSPPQNTACTFLPNLPIAQSGYPAGDSQFSEATLHSPQSLKAIQAPLSSESTTTSRFSTPHLSELCLTPNKTDKSMTYPIPGLSPMDQDLPIMSVEKDSSPPNDEIMRLYNRVHKGSSIPKLTKKAFQAYAAEHGLTGGERQDSRNDSLPFGRSERSPSSEETTKYNGTLARSGILDTNSPHPDHSTFKPSRGPSSTTSDLTTNGANGPMQKLLQRPIDKRRLYQQIESLLFTKLKQTCAKAHTVPPDLAKMFESLEKKFAVDVNFRNSVLLWTICRVKELRTLELYPPKMNFADRLSTEDKLPAVNKEPDVRLVEACNTIGRLERENEAMKNKMSDMKKYIAYLEAVNRRIPNPH